MRPRMCATGCATPAGIGSVFCETHDLEWAQSPEFADYRKNGMNRDDWVEAGARAIAAFSTRVTNAKPTQLPAAQPENQS